MARLRLLLVDGALVLVLELGPRADFGRTRVMDVEICRDVNKDARDSHAEVWFVFVESAVLFAWVFLVRAGNLALEIGTEYYPLYAGSP